MTAVQDLAKIRVAIKAQSGLGVPASGAAAFGLDVLSSKGMDSQAASIASTLSKQSRMRRKPRQGMRTVSAAYDVELSVGALDPIFEAILGGTQVPAQDFANADWGDCTISGGGINAVFTEGTLLTDGIVAGMFIKFTNLSIAGNNGVWVPIIAVTGEGACTFAPGFIMDNADDAAWSAVIAKKVSTATPYVDRYFSIEEYMPNTAVDQSKYGTDMRFNALTIAVDPKKYVTVSVGAAGRDLVLLLDTDAPVFTNPVFTESDSLILLDGGIYVNGVKRMDLTSLSIDLKASASGTAVIGTNVSPDISLGNFDLSGSLSGVIEDGVDFGHFTAEDTISILLYCKEKSTSNFVAFYFGNMSYMGFGSPVGGDGLTVSTIPLVGGEDDRGAGCAVSALVVSTSAT